MTIIQDLTGIIRIAGLKMVRVLERMNLMKATKEKTSGPLWLICGGRDFINKKGFEGAMRFITNRFGKPSSVLNGGARGADKIAKEWSDKKKYNTITEDADWDKYGKSAGPIRNRVMLGYNPDLVIAFPGGNGTADMVDISKKAGLAVIELTEYQVNDMEWMR